MKRAWSTGYIYVATEAGAEIPGSRRVTARCTTIEDYQRLWRSLEAQMGEGCMVKHSEVDPPVRSALRSRAIDCAMWAIGGSYFAAVLLNPPNLL